MAILPGPEASKLPQTTTLPPRLTVGMMFFLYEMLCWFYARCNWTHTFQEVQLLSHQSTEYLAKSLGDYQDIFWQVWDETLCSFSISSGFCLGTLPWMPFLPSLFLIVESWTLTLIEASEACSSLDVVLGSFMTSWIVVIALLE